MELALSLGDKPKPFPTFLDKSSKVSSKDLGFSVGLASSSGFNGVHNRSQERGGFSSEEDDRRVSPDNYSPPPLQLDLLPFSPVHPPTQPLSDHLHLPWLTDTLVSEPGSTGNNIGQGKDLDIRRFTTGMAEETEDGPTLSSPNSAMSSFQLEFCFRNGSGRSKRDMEVETHERTSDDDENGSTRKKLRLSKEQSAFLEESFKEHNTLNPKQKLALAKQLNLRPRQVEVWFQNRRARTKLKQTEVDCEYLKRCCETLTEENRRLQKELQELRALKTSQPFYMQLPATTLTMCPSCERVTNTNTTAAGAATTTSSPSAAGATNNNNSSSTQLVKPKLYPFPHVPQPQAPQSAS